MSQVLKRAVRNEKVPGRGRVPKGRDSLICSRRVVSFDVAAMLPCEQLSSHSCLARGWPHVLQRSEESRGSTVDVSERDVDDHPTCRQDAPWARVGGPSLEPKGALLGHTEQQCRIAAELHVD